MLYDQVVVGVLQSSDSRPECVREESGIRRLKTTRVTWTAVLPYSGREIELRQHERRFHGVEVELKPKNEEESHTIFREEEEKIGFHIIAFYDKL